MIVMNQIFTQMRREKLRVNSKEFKKALDNIVKEKDIDPEVVYSAMELALTSALKAHYSFLYL